MFPTKRTSLKAIPGPKSWDWSLKISAALILCGLGLLVSPQSTQAQIALVDSELNASTIPNADTANAHLALTTNLAVSASANTLVVEVAERNNIAAPNWPQTISWTNATATNTLTLAVAQASQAGSGGRNAIIYYCYNPTAGSGFNILGTGSITNASGVVVAFTLSGVDSTASPVTGSGSLQNGTAISFTKSVTTNSWAAVVADIATQTGTQTVTAQNNSVATGTPVVTTTAFAHTSTASVGYISAIVGGLDQFTYAYTTSGGNQSFAAAIFAPPGPPIITMQPAPDVVFPGQSPRFTVAASGTAPLSYQWMRGGTNLIDVGNISGSATNVLTVSNVSAADVTNNYQVVVTNSYGSVTSSVVSLSLATTNGAYEAAVLTNSPFAFYTFSETGDPTTGNVEAYDSTGVFNGAYGTGNDPTGSGALNGANGIAGPQTTADGLIGFADTNTALFCTYQDFPVDSYVTAPPFNLNKGAGTNVLTITAWIKPVGAQAHGVGIVLSRSGTTVAGLDYNATNTDGNLKLGYNWNNDPTAFNWDSGLEPTPGIWSLVALVITPTNSTVYLVNTNGLLFSILAHANVVQKFEGPTLIGNDIQDTTGKRNFEGTIDEVAFFGHALTANQISGLYAAASGIVFSPNPPTITTQPASITANTNQTVNFTVSATAATGYQWYYTNNAGLSALPADSGSTDYSGSQTTVLTFPNVALNDASNYVVVARNTYGSVTSSVAVLTVNQAATSPQLRMPFMGATGSTTALSDTSSGGINITMNMTSDGTTAADLHGAPGTGLTNVYVVNTTRALDMTTNTVFTQGTTQPGNNSGGGTGPLVSLDNDPTLATLGDGVGNITNFTVSFWIKQRAMMATVNTPRLWELTQGAVAGDWGGSANELSMQFQQTNEIYFALGTGGTGNATLDAVLASNLPVNQWIYFAVTYDGNRFIMYYGKDGAAATPIVTNALPGKYISLGAAASLAIGNRDNGTYTRAFNGWFQDFQFYNVCAGPNMVENIRQADAGPLPTIPAVTSQPQPVSAYPGQSVSFSVTAVGGSPNSYFWRTNGVIIGADGGSFSGSTNTTLSVGPVFDGMPTNYDVVITNSYGSVTSSVAVLTILTPGPATNFTLNYPNGSTPINQPQGSDWNTVNNWYPGGLSASVSAIYGNPGSSYEVVTGSRLRTPLGVTNDIFPGNALQIDGDGVYENGTVTNIAELRIKHTGIDPVTNYYANLVLNGGEVDNGDIGHLVVQGQMNVRSSSVFYIDSVTDSRSEEIDSWLTGSGNLFWHDNAFTNHFTNDMVIVCATNTFSGQWIVDQGALLGASANSLGTNSISVGASGLTAVVETLYDINNTNASLILGTNGQVYLHQNDHFARVTINGTSLTNGTYSFAALNSAYPSNFPAAWPQLVGSSIGTGSGQIIVVNASVIVTSPHITNIRLSGTTLSLSATNGTPGGPWTLLQSTNVSLPLSQWQTNIAGMFDGGGNLSTNIPNTATNGQEFYILKVQ
jgi:hypothetical protein